VLRRIVGSRDELGLEYVQGEYYSGARGLDQRSVILDAKVPLEPDDVHARRFALPSWRDSAVPVAWRDRGATPRRPVQRGAVGIAAERPGIGSMAATRNWPCLGRREV
jgi:hypothetical protein